MTIVQKASNVMREDSSDKGKEENLKFCPRALADKSFAISWIMNVEKLSQ